MEATNTLKRQTINFISQNPATIVIQRPIDAADGAGGFRTTPTPLAPQVVRIIEQAVGDSVSRLTVSGNAVYPGFVLVGPFDMDIENGDTFPYNGYAHEVVFIHDRRSYETQAEVMRGAWIV